MFWMRDSKLSLNILLEKGRMLEEGLGSLGVHLKYLEKQGFKDLRLEKGLNNIKTLLEELLEKLKRQ